MRISIAMTTYNGARYLQEQLDSFLFQICQPDELVVCDDGSTDATLEILEAFRQLAPFAMHIYRNETNLGPTKNFEKTLSLCCGDLIFLSDQDDVWDADKISIVSDCAQNNPDVDVVINDAYYTDEKLSRFGVTVLQKVRAVGGNNSNHGAGACTAFKKRFLDFILPFPKDNCPQHDTYIHRWANFIGNKLVLDIPLQIWRIHGLNATVNNEMSQPEIVSPLRRYFRAKNVDVTKSYHDTELEFHAMNQVLLERSEWLLCLPRAPSVDDVRLKINQTIDAYASRSRLIDAGWLKQKQIIFQMIIKGQYKYFEGFKSIAKDFLR